MSKNYIPFTEKRGVPRPVGRVWPNGEFTIGYSVGGGMELSDSVQQLARGMNNHLGLSLPVNSHTPRDEGKSPRGTRGLTSHGKKVLRNAVARMQRLYGKKRLSFVTLTLPNLSYELHWYLSSNWSSIVRVFFQKLGRKLESHGLPSVYASCTEMQPKRLANEDVPALHLHFLVVGRSGPNKGWVFRPSDFRALWASVLRVYIREDFDTRALENVQMVRLDASAYMSKYLSKGVSMDEPPRRDEVGWSLPTAWYNVSLRLRQWVLDNIRRCPKLMECLERSACDGSLSGFCHYFFPGVIEEATGPGPHYFVGKLKGEYMAELISSISQLREAGAW